MLFAPERREALLLISPKSLWRIISMKQFAIATCIGILAFGSASAQEFAKFNASIGAGFTAPVGSTGRSTDYGWNARGGIGYNASRFAGIKLNVGFDQLGFSGSTLSRFGVPGGDVQVLSATLEPVIHLMPIHHADVYAMAGGGVFHFYQEFTAPKPGSGVPVFGGTFGGNSVLTSYTVTKPGFDVGAGVSMGGWKHARFFAEARWERAFLNFGNRIDMVPVTFGFRW
jgi:hypothetical protein